MSNTQPLTVGRNVHVISLGCARNLVDSEVMMGHLLEHGWSFTADQTHADAVVINTCGFIGVARQESIDRILEASERKKNNPAQKLIVAGCLAQRYKSQLSAELPEVDLFIGTDQFHRIGEFLSTPPLQRTITKHTGYIYSADEPRINTLSPHSAYVKIAEGCQHRCAFCVIPVIRGTLRSRTITDIAREVEHLVDQGVIEIILIAQDLAAFGRDRANSSDNELLPLLKRLTAIVGLRWLRLLYIYPEHIDDAFLDFFAENEKIVKYLDIPVQHASDRILHLMRRDIDRQGLENILSKVRRRVPDISLRTSVMVGFPTEDGADFNTLKAFVADQEFDHLGCFTYSLEKNTVAGRMHGQISEHTKKSRHRQIMTLQQHISQTKLQKKIGTTCDTLIEKKEGDLYVGRLSTQAPEVDGLVYINRGDPPIGTIQPIVIDATSAYDLIGRYEG